jgi:hypothetical protein
VKRLCAESCAFLAGTQVKAQHQKFLNFDFIDVYFWGERQRSGRYPHK